MSEYSHAFKALTSDTALSAGGATQMLARLRAEAARELAEQQRTWAQAEYRIEDTDSYAAQRIKRRKLSAVRAAADQITSAKPVRRTPPPKPGPGAAAPVDGSPAARVAAAMARQPEVEHLEVLDTARVRVHARPQTLDCWRWWLARFNVEVGSITSKGSYITGKGSHNGVQVLIAGLGVPALYAAAKAGEQP